MKLLWCFFACFALLGPLAVIAQTDPSITFEEATENQTEASPSVVEEVTEHSGKTVVEFDTAEGFTESPENAVGPDASLVPEEPEKKALENLFVSHGVNVSLQLPGENHTIPNVGNDITEKVGAAENKTEAVIPEVGHGIRANGSEPAFTGETLDLTVNHTGKDLSHDTIAHYPFNN